MAHSPFSFSQSLPVRHHSFDYSLPSPLSTSINIAGHMRNNISGGTGVNSGGVFNTVKFGNEHPEPPVSLPPAIDAIEQGSHQRSRSQSSAHSVGKAPSSRSRQARKSMTDVRPPRSSLQRGRSQGPTRPMGLGMSLDTHVEGEMTDSISPPDFGANGAFGLAIAAGRDSFNNDTSSWASGSVPSMVPGSLGSFDTDEVLVDSPITPVKPSCSCQMRTTRSKGEGSVIIWLRREGENISTPKSKSLGRCCRRSIIKSMSLQRKKTRMVRLPQRKRLVTLIHRCFESS